MHWQPPPLCRGISSHAARAILGLPSETEQNHTTTTTRTTTLTLPQLRQAYLTAAKQCHPDVVAPKAGAGPHHKQEAHVEFLRITQAYERLQDDLMRAQRKGQYSNYNYDDDDDDEYDNSDSDFDAACQQQLGLSAEIVEECKQNPIFRQWLQNNNSHWAQIWRTFLASHGGWTPRLVKPSLGCGSTSGFGGSSSTNRRRRRRR